MNPVKQTEPLRVTRDRKSDLAKSSSIKLFVFSVVVDTLTERKKSFFFWNRALSCVRLWNSVRPRKKVRLFAIPNIRYDVPLTYLSRETSKATSFLAFQDRKVALFAIGKEARSLQSSFHFWWLFYLSSSEGLKGKKYVGSCHVQGYFEPWSMQTYDLCFIYRWTCQTDQCNQSTLESIPLFGTNWWSNSEWECDSSCRPRRRPPGAANAHAEPESDSHPNIKDCDLDPPWAERPG